MLLHSLHTAVTGYSPVTSFYTKKLQRRRKRNEGSKRPKQDLKKPTAVCEKNDFWKHKERWWVWVGADQEIELSGWTMRRAQTFSAFPFILLYSRVHVHCTPEKGHTLTHRILLLEGDQWEFFVFCVKEHSTVCDRVWLYCLVRGLVFLRLLSVWAAKSNSIEVPRQALKSAIRGGYKEWKHVSGYKEVNTNAWSPFSHF